jgi:hypothetical protein
LNPKQTVGPFLAVLILALVGAQTSDALRHSGVWGTPKPKRIVPTADPYAHLEAQLAIVDPSVAAEALRDPFSYGAPPRPVHIVGGVVRPAPPPPPPKPVLTAIVMDEDPRALLQYQDHNYSVKTGDLFAEFRVVSISRDEVVLDGRGQQLVLRRPSKGE